MAKRDETKHGGARKGAGRKPNAAKGLEVRDDGLRTSVRLSPSEFELLSEKAEAAGKDLSTYLRDCALAAV